MLCVSISDSGLDACKKALRKCEKYRKQFPDLVAEIHLDLCGLKEKEIFDLFSTSKIPLIAVANKKKKNLYTKAIMSGAEYIEMNIFSYISLSDEEKALICGKKVKKIFSFSDLFRTPSTRELMNIYNEAVEAGADIVKIITTASSVDDAERVLSLYSLKESGKLDGDVPLVAYAADDIARYSCLESYSLGAPFIYCSLHKKYPLIPGMFTLEEIEDMNFGNKVEGEISMPASKSIAQRAIIASVLAKGESVFYNFSHCYDIDTAVSVAKQFSNDVRIEKDILYVNGSYPYRKKKVSTDSPSLLPNMYMQEARTVFVGESGLLSRLSIPIMGQIGESVTLTGDGKLLDRSMAGCKEVMEELGASCVFTAEETLPVMINGPLKGGEITISGTRGTQFISGLLMALPLSRKNSRIIIEHPTSVSYLLLTLYVLKRFGIEMSYKYEGEDLVFEIPGRQKYHSAEMTFEGDWPLAANFIVMAAIFGDLKINSLNMGTIQEERKIIDIVESHGAAVERQSSSIRVRRGHLKAFRADVYNTPDLLPPLSILATFSEGVSIITGINHATALHKERLMSIISILEKMGVELEVDGDVLRITGMSLWRRRLEGKMLKGGSYSSHGDHRVAMGLLIVSLGAEGKVSIDDTDCIAKSFPQFKELFKSVIKK